MSSEGKRWTMRYRRFEDDTSAIPFVADGPEIEGLSIEVAPASEVERLRSAIEEHTAWTIGAKVDPLTPKGDEWRHDQALRAALHPDEPAP